ncbi:hypothetical protein HF520_06470 [Romboutsia sp. CE17]|uniref:hypothetical protein n=1 Tax=Romboutsia sp. CE17 TaxID=2724150 RepID=UPI001442A51B|nr:hypothetical protein [Romboutsia sp. CE17]QJA08606.1 hypothetical protein HF520_06470 [Romboutsia sp. CE17]
MNKKFRGLVLSGVLSISMIAPLGITSDAASSEVDVGESLTNDMEIRDANGKLLKLDELIVESEVVDVEIENSDVLVEEGLLSANYKSEMIRDLNTRLQKDITVWFDYPTTITHNFIIRNPYDGNKKIVSLTSKGTFAANASKKLKSSIAISNKVNYNGYITTLGAASQGSYVGKGGTSKATRKLSATKVGYASNSHTFSYGAKYTKYVPSYSTQVGFGINATVTYS